MIVVADIERSRRFYVDILKTETELDLGVYVVFRNAFSMMSLGHWQETIRRRDAIDLGARNFELYFEEDEIEAFARGVDGAWVFTPLEEMPWGQRTMKISDPDGHVVEVAESMPAVMRRLLESGLSAEEVAQKTMFPLEFVRRVAAGSA
jgi:catechol 2,3-dioxygenase-like lactoylglutathione lyase family enzyme